jgi:DNA-binding transcriptional LysR family regulator
MLIDPRRLLTFRAAARRRSFSRAAEELSLTQSAVSQQVAALERQIGVQLMRRGRGGVVMTPAGERLLEHATAVADRLELAEAQLGELAAQERRELRVGAFPSALATILPAAAARLVAQHPDLDLRLHEGRLDELAAGVRTGDLHAALSFQDAAAARREHDGTRRHDLTEEPMMLALPPRHRLARRRAVRLAELAGEAWTAASREGMIVQACRAAGFEPRVTIVTSDPLAIRAVVHAGLAVTLTPRLLAAHLPGVRIADLDGPPPRRSLYALLPETGARAVDLALLEELRAATTAPGSLLKPPTGRP